MIDVSFATGVSGDVFARSAAIFEHDQSNKSSLRTMALQSFTPAMMA